MSYNSKLKGAEVEAKLDKIDLLNAGMEDTDETVEDVAEFPYVSYNKQEATEEQKEQARNNIGAYSKPSDGIPKTDLASDVQTSLDKADTALQSIPSEYVTETKLTEKGYATTEQVNGKQDKITDLDTIRSGAAKGATALQSYTEKYTGTITGITMNGASKGTSGVVNLGTVITAHQDISGKQDKLVSGTNIKTINGNSILGSGDIGFFNYVQISGATYTISSMAEDTFYYNTTAMTRLTISAFSYSGKARAEYKVVFKSSSSMSLTLPAAVYWAHGEKPTIESNTLYELSIERGINLYKAVLIPFKQV